MDHKAFERDLGRARARPAGARARALAGSSLSSAALNRAQLSAGPRSLAHMIASEAVSAKLLAHQRGRASARAKPSLYYGGQAVMEGVMIRGPRYMAIAVRAPNGDIVRHSEALAGVYTGWPRRIPVVRGIVVLYETLALGIRALNWSTQVALGRGDEETSKIQLIVSLAVTLLFVGAIFFAGPVLITSWLGRVIGNDYLEVAIEGVLRLAMFVGYIWLLGRSSDIQRVFAYHGAEHRAIHAHEDGRDLTPAAVREYPNAHPRCGTAFLLIVMVISLVVFVLLGAPPIWLRLVERIVLIPVIAAIAYEVLRLSQRFGERGVFGLIYRPNIWLQSFTTRDPDDAQIEVAIAALEQVIALENGSDEASPSLSQRYLDEPITSRGIGGIEIGDSLESVQSTLGRPLRRRAGKVPAEEVTILEYLGLSVIASKQIVDVLLAEPGYTGTLDGADGVRVGMSWSALTEVLPGLQYDDDLLTWRAPGWPGIEIQAGLPLGPGETSTGPGAEEVYSAEHPDTYVASISISGKAR